ncbi:MAG: diaminopimelate epimerase [Candidatus Marinimicrobia bacterium]|nr:diaminopimelate epimerase [Candidatus Neomarinimicrobiota bacterium]
MKENMKNKTKISFVKLQSTGNDFILFDLQKQKLPDNFISLIPQICDRHLGIGADGILLIDKNNSYPFKMTFYNADGSKGKFCGNGSRALVKYAFENNLCSKKGTFIADDGIHDFNIDNESIEVSISAKTDFTKFQFENELHYLYKIGVNHFVIPTENVENFNVVKRGKYLHDHQKYKKINPNFNFIKQISDSKIKIRTYENGVNDETLSCATGSIASSIFANSFFNMEYPIVAISEGGNIIIDKRENKFWLKGKTEITYNGEYFYDK